LVGCELDPIEKGKQMFRAEMRNPTWNEESKREHREQNKDGTDAD
jgi:hypothetical protein